MKTIATAIVTTTRNNETLSEDIILYWSKVFARKALKTVCYSATKNETATNNKWTEKHDSMIIGRLSDEMEDIEHECFIAIWILHKSGLCTNETELYRYRRFVYRVANTYITKQKRNGQRTNTRLTTTDSNGNDIAINDRYIDRCIKETEKADIIEVLYRICDGIISKRTDRKQIKAVLNGFYNGQTEEQTAKILGVSHQRINKLKKDIFAACNTPEVYEYLHIIIHDEYSEE